MKHTTPPPLKANTLLDAAIELGRTNPTAAEIATMLMRRRQLAAEAAGKLIIRSTRKGQR